MYEEWLDCITDFLIWMTASGATAGTIKLRRGYLTRFARTVQTGPWEIVARDLTQFVAAFTGSQDTRRSAAASLRSFYRWAHADGRTVRNLAVNLPAVRAPRRKKRPTPEAVFLAATTKVATMPRERLMLKLATHGLRRAEIAMIRGDHLDERNWLYVLGKGGAERQVPIEDAELVTELRAAGACYLFPGGADGHISAWWVGVLLKRLLDADGWTGHSLRHRFGTRGFSGPGAPRDIRAVQELLGHADLNTTMVYTDVADEALIATVRAAVAA